MKNKELWLIAGVAFVAGLLVGLVIGDAKKNQTVQVAGQAVSAQQAISGNSQLDLLNSLVANEPNNFNAWVQLAHHYFDASQPMEAVKAYGKALELHPNDVDLLTDQGVMFRRLGWYDRAVENFSRAADIDPNHIHSVYNLGIVYRYDLNDSPKAIEAWNRYLQRDPQGESAESVRRELDQMRVGVDTRMPQ
ncbi:MAG: hypothetical protein B6I37_00190 [Desulfobacteraceae bacterium 4572_35.2]|nr:MAG: hypothetical protein B6I37_00190 [Desulfobacteraceae bacterium 4572_35.2]